MKINLGKLFEIFAARKKIKKLEIKYPYIKKGMARGENRNVKTVTKRTK